MKNRLVKNSIRYALILECGDMNRCSCCHCLDLSGKTIPQQHITDIPLFYTPAIVLVTKDFERTFDGQGIKLYRHNIKYRLYKTLDAVMKAYVKHTDYSLPNGMDVKLDKKKQLKETR